MRCLTPAILLVCGCGRYGFEQLASADGAAHLPALTEDFESGVLVERWRSNPLNGTVVVDSTRPHGGAYSLHAQSVATTASIELYAAITETETFPALQAGLFARAFVYIATTGPVGGMQPLLQLQRQGFQGHQLGPTSDRTLSFYQWGTNPDVWNGSTSGFPYDQWVCLEWHMLTGESRTWVNGMELTDLHEDGLAQVAYDSFVIGLFQYRSAVNEPPHDEWFDDVVLDTQPIGCT